MAPLALYSKTKLVTDIVAEVGLDVVEFAQIPGIHGLLDPRAPEDPYLIFRNLDLISRFLRTLCTLRQERQ
jgi:hypothetical protein